MVSNDIFGGCAFRIAIGIMTLALLLAGGAEALPDWNISSHSDNHSFFAHRPVAGITSNRDLGVPMRNATVELISKGLKAGSRHGRIPANKNLLTVRSIEKEIVKIPAEASWFISDNATGGDCIFIGTWNIEAKTCTLTTDLTNTIEIDSDNITLDGNGHTITGSNSGYGIYLSGRSGVTIKNTNIRSFYDDIYLYYSSNNVLSGNNASNSGGGDGIFLYNSDNNTLSGNNVNSNSDDGIELYMSGNNTLSGNYASSNSYGIYLYNSGNNTLFNNKMNNNSFNFGLFGWSDSDFNNQIDYSNTVDGKPIYYVKNANDTVYDSSTNAGVFYCISCLNVTIKDTELFKNDIGILFWNTTISKIQNVTVSNNGDGIFLLESGNNTLSGNNVYSNIYDGIYLEYSSNNTLNGNNASSNKDDGIDMDDSSNNTLSGNNASNNTFGIYLYYSGNNTLLNNTMTKNSFNFGLSGSSDSDFNNQIDYYNTVDGKPIYYIKNAKDTVYDSSTNAGVFFCIRLLQNINYSTVFVGIGDIFANHFSNPSSRSNLFSICAIAC